MICDSNPALFFFCLQKPVRQQGEHDSLHRDMMVGFGKWDWSPLEMENPFAGA